MDEILCGDALEMLKKMPDESVQCIITSPPYFGLRDYGQDGQIGLEESPDQYVQKLVDVFREARRVLKSDGTLWLNLGDSYAGSGRGRDADESHSEKNFDTSLQATNRGSVAGRLINNRSLSKKLIEKGAIGNKWVKPPRGLKRKDLIGIPWMVAFALRTDGWYLRQDIIWQKPNPMPESVTDRCTKSHEYVFLFSKRSRYFFDQKAISEPARWSTIARLQQNIEEQKGSDRVPRKTNDGRNPLVNKRSVWSVIVARFKEAHFATFPEKLIEPMILAGSPRGGGCARYVHGCRYDGCCRQKTRTEVSRHRTQSRLYRDRAKASV